MTASRQAVKEKEDRQTNGDTNGKFRFHRLTFSAESPDPCKKSSGFPHVIFRFPPGPSEDFHRVSDPKHPRAQSSAYLLPKEPSYRLVLRYYSHTPTAVSYNSSSSGSVHAYIQHETAVLAGL